MKSLNKWLATWCLPLIIIWCMGSLALTFLWLWAERRFQYTEHYQLGSDIQLVGIIWWVAGIPLVVWSVVRGIRGMNGNLD